MKTVSLWVIVLFAVFTLIAFAGVSMAQAPAKQADKPTVPAATDKSAASAAEKPKAEAPKAEKKEAIKMMDVSGTVAAYQAGKMIKVKGKDKEMAFDVTGDTNVKGDVKEGANVTVLYKKDGDKMVATSIAVAAEKKKAPEKK